MDALTALSVLEDAVERSRTDDDVSTPEVLAALDFLQNQTTIAWPLEQFRRNLAPKNGELDLNKEGRRQVLNASLNGIKSGIKIGTGH
jgi:hypothetical protein